MMKWVCTSLLAAMVATSNLVDASTGQPLLRPANTSSQSGKKLLQPRPDPSAAPNRWRVAHFDHGLALRAAHSPAMPLAIDLFDDVKLTGRVQTRVVDGRSSLLQGTLSGGGHFNLYLHRSGAVRGEFHPPGGFYSLRSEGDDLVVIADWDTSGLPACGGTAYLHGRRLSSTPDHTGPLTMLPRSNQRNAAANLDVNRGALPIDVLMVYNQAFEDYEGGAREAVATIEFYEAAFNQILAHSGLSHRRIRVTAQKIDVESTAIADVAAAYETQFWMERHRADMVHILVSTSIMLGEQAVCGVGRVEERSPPEQAECDGDDLCEFNQQREGRSIFSASSIRCGTVAFAHQLGHNFGLGHERSERTNRVADTPNSARLPYGFAHVDRNAGATIMYSSAAWPYFSNAKLSFPPSLYRGARPIPMGEPGEQRTDALYDAEPTQAPGNGADAARAIDEYWDIVAAISDPPATRLPGALVFPLAADESLSLPIETVFEHSEAWGRSLAYSLATDNEQVAAARLDNDHLVVEPNYGESGTANLEVTATGDSEAITTVNVQVQIAPPPPAPKWRELLLSEATSLELFAENLEIGGSTVGRVDYDDVDIYRVVVSEPGTLKIYSNGSTVTEADLWSGGRRIAEGLGRMDAPDLVIEEIGTSRSEATEISIPDSVSGRIEQPGQRHYFRINLSSDQNLVVATHGDLLVEGTLTSEDWSFSGRRVVNGLHIHFDEQLAAGTYFLTLRARDDVSTGTYTLQFNPPVFDDHSDWLSGATVVSAPGIASGRVNPTLGRTEDLDYFQFNVPSERIVVIATVGDPKIPITRIFGPGPLTIDATVDRPSYGWVHEYRLSAGIYHVLIRSPYPSENSAGERDDKEMGSIVFEHPVEPGIYYVVLKGLSSESGYMIHAEMEPAKEEPNGIYMLHLDPPVFDDHSDWPSDATNVSVPSSTHGRIQPGGDIDYFRFSLDSEQYIAIVIIPGNRTYTGVSLFNVNRTDMMAEEVLAIGGRREYDAYLPAGAYFVGVSVDEVVDYSLQLNPPVEDDHSDYRAGATLVSIPGTASGQLGSRQDRDVFRFSLPAESTLKIDLMSATHGGHFLSLFDADRVQLASGEQLDNGYGIERRLVGGTYFVIVRPTSRGAGATSTDYTLRLAIE